MCAVTAADKEYMLDSSLLNGTYDFFRIGKNSTMCEARSKHMAPIDTAHAVVMLIPSQFQCLFNQRCEILIAVFICCNVS